MAISPGDQFGRLVAIERRGARRWLFSCSCGATKDALASNVVRGLTQSCGCLRREATKIRATTHGHTAGGRASSTFKAWSHAKARCTNPADKSFPDYGGRGIRMTPRWREDFNAFLADMGECPSGMTLDRIDPNGDYEPGNCRWADRLTQGRNRRCVRVFDLYGKASTLTEACAEHGVDYQQAYHWVVRRGWTLAATVEYLKSKPARHARPTGRQPSPTRLEGLR